MTDITTMARACATGIEAKGWVGGVPNLLRDLAERIDVLRAASAHDELLRQERDSLAAEVSRLKRAIKATEAHEWRDGGEPLSALCMEAAGRVDDGEQVAGLSELLRAASLRLQEVGA